MMVYEMKDKVKKEYYGRLRKVLETKLNRRNVFKAINTRELSVVRYSAGFLGLPRLQLEKIDRRTSKLLTMHNGFHPKSNVDWFYLLKSEGNRELTGVQDNVKTAILELSNYVRNNEERLLLVACTTEDNKNRETPNEYKKDNKIKNILELLRLFRKL